VKYKIESTQDYALFIDHEFQQAMSPSHSGESWAEGARKRSGSHWVPTPSMACRGATPTSAGRWKWRSKNFRSSATGLSPNFAKSITRPWCAGEKRQVGNF